jgi:uncharacterized protein (TIGR03118 family)
MHSPRRVLSIFNRLAILVLLLALMQSVGFAQYTVTNMVSNQKGIAKHRDKALLDGWGVAYAPRGPFWVGDSNSGVSTYYTGKGKKVGEITVPGGLPGFPSQPTGVIYNSTSDFQISENGNTAPALFLFASFDGTISGWNPEVDPSASVIMINDVEQYTWFTGLAIGNYQGANYLYGVDTTYAIVRIYDASFKEVTFFQDKKLKGYIPFNVQIINNQLWILFYTVDNKGAVEIFDLAGNFVKHFSRDKHLKQPWGVAVAPKNFGPFSNDLLVANFGDGCINAFDIKTGKYLGQLKDNNNKVISIDGLWGITFGDGGGQNGYSNQLFFAAGPNDEKNGLFGVIELK